MPLLGRDNIDKAIDDLYLSTNDNLRGIYLAGLAEIQKGTPVDEGRARNNWFISSKNPSSRKTTARGQGRNISIPKIVLGKVIFFTNNLPYINKLEYGGFTSKSETNKTRGGFSKQAPNGWVRKTLIKMQNKIRTL